MWISGGRVGSTLARSFILCIVINRIVLRRYTARAVSVLLQVLSYPFSTPVSRKNASARQILRPDSSCRRPSPSQIGHKLPSNDPPTTPHDPLTTLFATPNLGPTPGLINACWGSVRRAGGSLHLSSVEAGLGMGSQGVLLGDSAGPLGGSSGASTRN